MRCPLGMGMVERLILSAIELWPDCDWLLEIGDA
jgi:hypothetical protein